MLQIPAPKTDAAGRRAGWHALTEIFSGLLRESFVSEGSLDIVSLYKALDEWQSFALAWDKRDLLGHPNTLDEWERMRAMLWCADFVQKSTSLPGESPPVALTDLPATAPREALSREDWSVACMRLFGGEGPTRRIAVPIALADEMVQLKGGIATLVLDVFAPGTGRLTLDPEESFRVSPDADFTESLRTAWRFALEIAKSDDRLGSLPDVVWRVFRESPSMSGLEDQVFFESVGLRWKDAIVGRSASGAAARAFRLLLKGTNIEPDVFVLAQVRRDVMSAAANPLLSVRGITAKVEAIAATDQHAVIIVTEGDRAEAELAVSKQKAASRIEVRVSIPPAIEKLLEDANKLSDDDRFAEAIPVFEKALDAAREATHRTAEVTIRTRLGRALFESREDSAAAEAHFRKALELTGKSPSLMRHSALHGLGDMLLWAGRLDDARAAIQASLEVAKIIGSEASVGRSLISQGLLDHHLGDAESARSRLEEAIQIFSKLSLTVTGEAAEQNAHALAVCYHNKAQLECDDGRTREALAIYAKVEDLHRDSGDKLNAGKIHLLRGQLHCANGEAEQGFRCFKQALGVFLDLTNHLWMARSMGAIARLYAQHAQVDGSPNTELWEEAAKAAFAAIDGFEEANAISEEIDSILFAAQILAHLVKAGLRANVHKQIHDICTRVAKEHQAQAAADVSAQMDRVHAEIEEKVRTDEEIGRLLNEAHELAEKHSLHEKQAECFVAECRMRIAEDATEERKKLLEKALACLQIAMPKENIPKRKAHLMGKIGTLHRELGQQSEWASWVKRVGTVFEKTGDVFGLANYHLELADVHRSQGRLDEQILSCRKVLELIEGRAFHNVAAIARLTLAEGLRFRGERTEALSLLAEAEAICEVHKMQGLVDGIARIRSAIEEDNVAGQAASHTLPELLDSLGQLLRYRSGRAITYLAFWYFVWKKELMALFRSGPGLSLMVVTDDVNRFMALALKFNNVADHFLMAPTQQPTEAAESGVFAIPPTWFFPGSFDFLFMSKSEGGTGEFGESQQSELGDGLPNVVLSGPAKMLPAYIPVSVQTDTDDQFQFSSLTTPRVPKAAVELMIDRSIDDLIRRRAVWFPSPRFESTDPFQTDLRIAHERGVFPVYFDRLPSSDGTAEIGAVTIRVPASVLAPAGQNRAEKWKRALLRIPLMQKEAAQADLLDLAEAFSADDTAATAAELEVHLFEFTEISHRVVRPVLLVRDGC